MLTSAHFHDILAAHDWFFQMSDDHSNWERGMAAQERIGDIVREQPELAPQLSAWVAWINKKGERPLRPSEVSVVESTDPDQLPGQLMLAWEV